MNANLKIVLIILLCFAVLYVYLFFSKRALKDVTLRSMKRKWGKIPEREYEYEEFERISHYFQYKQKKEPDTHYIDDITWNDLDMDSIFCMVNNTNSSVGEEYLYYLLRTPKMSQEVLSERERLQTLFKEHPEDRIKMQYLFYEIGSTKKIALVDYIGFLGNVRKESNWKHYILVALYIISILIMMMWIIPGIMVFIAAMTIAIQTYFKRKREIEPYIISFSYILRLLRAADQFGKAKVNGLDSYTEAVIAAKAKFRKFETGSIFLTSSKSMGASVRDDLLDYVRILFHLDLIKFNSMQEEIQKHIGEVEIILDQMGAVESAIAVASFRETLPFYTLPVLHAEKKANMEAADIYHPMIVEPVANSIKAKNGVLITGSNASGKSTFLKTTAINTILSQTIYTAVASKYEASFFQIYTSMALKDSLENKESYYIVEIKSLKRILNHKEDEIPMLCFVDEVLRGTNTVERIAASSQILKSLAVPQVLCFAATHDIELTYILEECYENYHFQEEIKENDILFNYQLMVGRATSRNAIGLLRIIGYEREIIEDAERTASRFVETGEWSL